jgi:hypothetical protein
MPKRVIAGGCGKGAASKKKSGVTATTRESPSRSAKTAANDRIAVYARTAANERIAAQLNHPERALTAPPGAEVDATIVIPTFPPLGGMKSPVEETPLANKLDMPPLWNAWYSACCQVLHYVGDGGALTGSCVMCGGERPVRHYVMLDPDQVYELENTPFLAYNAMTATTMPMPSLGLSTSKKQGARSSSTTTEEDESYDDKHSDNDDSSLSNASPRASQYKTSETTTEMNLGMSPDNVSSPNANDESPPPTPTDNEVSKFSFYDRLKHYMEGNKINESNRAAVELCILVEAGAAVRGLDPMKKEKKERIYYAKYMRIIDEIDDCMFSNSLLRDTMRQRYKNAKKDNTGTSLWRKYEAELRELRNFAKKIPGVGSLSELPSGSNQLRHMKMPLVEALWKEKNPVQSIVVI